MASTKNELTLDELLKEELVKCAHCGKLCIPNDIVDVDGEEWCEDCAREDAYWCDRCEEWTTEPTYEVEGEMWCHSCAEAHAHWCAHCEEWTTGETYTVYTNDGEQRWCESCVDNDAVTCHCCGEYYSEDNYDVREVDVYDAGYVYLCDNCRYDNYSYCNICDRYVHDSDSYYDDDEDEYYCPDCWERHQRERRGLQGYGHTCGMRFFKDDGSCVESLWGDDSHRLFLGIELETDYNDDAPELACDIIDAVSPEAFCCKRDGSLHSEGVEIVSQPATPLWHLNSGKWEDIIRIVREHGGKSHDAGTCGLHIHLSKSALTADAAYRIDRLFHRFSWQILKFSRRSFASLRWCRLDSDDPLASIEDLDERKRRWSGNKYERYDAVNTTNEQTVEIRMWRGTLNRTTLRATIEFTAGLALVCNDLNDTMAEKLTWPTLLSLIRYQLLRNHITYDDMDEYLSIRDL